LILGETMNYFIDYNKSANASCITWISNENKITSLTPFIDSIICDNGEEYIELWGDDFEKLALDNFEAVKGDDEDTYILCYIAVVSINLDNHIDFKDALQFSENMVEVKIGFKDSDGNEVEDVSEGNYDIPVELAEISDSLLLRFDHLSKYKE
tara:strand:- start:529 stop:987 length:459 start_codon:yes stop_codon:yes gene_type:complete